MDIRVMEMATNLTIKAMGAEGSSTAWINSPDDVVNFIIKMAATLSDIGSGTAKPSRS